METQKIITVESTSEPTLKGRVTLISPTVAELIKIGMIQHRLRSGIPLEELDDRSAALVIMLSTLAVAVREAPDWWYRIDTDPKTGKELRRTPAPEQLRDSDLLWFLYGEYVTFLGQTSGTAEAALATAQPVTA